MFADADVAVQITPRRPVVARLALAAHPNFHSGIDTRGDLHFERSLRLEPTASAAVGARVADLSTAALAARAGGSNAKEALRLQHFTAAATVGTGDRLRARLGTVSLAGRADLFATHVECSLCSLRRFKQVELDLNPQVAAGPRSAACSSAEQVAEHAAAEYLAKCVEDVLGIIEFMEPCTRQA